MANNDLSLVSEFSGLNMDSLIGGPLMAAANANNMMAMTQTKFLLDTCFSRDMINDPKDPALPKIPDPKSEYKPIMVDMSMSVPMRADDGKIGLPSTIKFQLPLLTIVPLNSLAVETAEVTFEMEVKSTFAEDQDEKKETELKAGATFDAKIGIGPFSCSIKGNVSYDQKDSVTHKTHYEKSNSAKYNVKVTAGQLPLPKGVNTILDIFSKAIGPLPSAN